MVYIIYAGHSANYHNNKVSNIWPKSGTITVSNKFDGKSIRRYGVSNELNGSDKTSKNNKKINGIGLFCHEFSHTLGLPDIYALDEEAKNQDDQGMEFWDLMDGGTEVRGGRVPASYLAWEREVMGWMTLMSISYCRVYRKDHGIKVGEMVLMVRAYLSIEFHIRLTK